MYVVFPFFLMSFIVCFRMMRWSTVALPCIPPACASVISTIFFAHSFIILSYTFLKLLANVMPLSFEHLPFVPFLLYHVFILLFCHSCGTSDVCNSLNILVWCFASASVNNSLGIPSGPRLFALFRDLIT